MHKNADVDALASAYYLSIIFGNSVIASDGMDRFAKTLAEKFSINVVQELPGENFEEIITVDAASREQLGKFKDMWVDAVYDHHASNDIIAETRMVKEDYPSCAEMLYDIFGKVNSREAGILLLGGIITDTRWFRFANTRTFEIFNRIMKDMDIEFSEISELFDFPYVQSEKVAILKGFQRMKFRTKGRKIICATVVGAYESSFAVFVQNLVDVVFVASQRKKEVRIIGRSKEADLLEIFRLASEDFGCTYGGHRNAAGMACMGDPEAILNALMKITEKFL